VRQEDPLSGLDDSLQAENGLDDCRLFRGEVLADHQQPLSSGELALCLLGKSSLRLWSHSTAERLIKQFARAGLRKAIAEERLPHHEGPLILVRADSVLDQPLISTLMKAPGLILLAKAHSDNVPAAAHVLPADVPAVAEILRGKRLAPADFHIRICTPSALGVAFWKQLRKREVPYAFVLDAQNQAEVEWRSFIGTYKGATDFVTKRLWPVPAFYATRALARTPITPNLVTALAGLLVFVAFALFLHGYYAWGLAAAWFMTFLDTVDGKLARTTMTSSKWGDILDHGIDLIHPPFWYVAWALGLQALGVNWTSTLFWLVIGAILGGYVIQRLMEGVAIKWLGLEIHIWRPIDTRFREITARRNPNLIILTLSVIFGRPDLGLIAVAVWIVICLLLHAVQLTQALIVRTRLGSLTSWMHEAG
jgi:phosphatidylglycerophosphate synthase